MRRQRSQERGGTQTRAQRLRRGELAFLPRRRKDHSARVSLQLPRRRRLCSIAESPWVHGRQLRRLRWLQLATSLATTIGCIISPSRAAVVHLREWLQFFCIHFSKVFQGKSVVRKGLQDQISQEKPPAGYSFFVSTRCCRQGPTRPCSRGGYSGYGGYGPVL